MHKVVALGETVLDILFSDNTPIAAKAGGAMLNTAVSLGRLKIPVHLISEIGKDLAGGLILDFLQKNNVDSSMVRVYDLAQTPVSIAALDKQGRATYNFYKNYPEKRHLALSAQFAFGDYLIFGSFYSLTPSIRNDIKTIVARAKENGAIVLYDPNIRKNHRDQISGLRYELTENFRMADITRASEEDMFNIFGTDNLDEILKQGSSFLKVCIITRGAGPVLVHSPAGRFSFQVPRIIPVSTVGAGDTFNAGLIYAIRKFNITSQNINVLRFEDWERIIRTAIQFASDACLSYENYISEDFAQNLS